MWLSLLRLRVSLTLLIQLQPLASLKWWYCGFLLFPAQTGVNVSDGEHYSIAQTCLQFPFKPLVAKQLQKEENHINRIYRSHAFVVHNSPGNAESIQAEKWVILVIFYLKLFSVSCLLRWFKNSVELFHPNFQVLKRNLCIPTDQGLHHSLMQKHVLFL